MFCKFFAHDLRHGLGNHPCRLGVGFLLFFCLSSYHFLTLRIYELTNPEFFETPVTTGDYFLALTGGCGKVESVPGGGTTFTMPVLWITFVLWILFASLYYPFLDLQGMVGLQMPVDSLQHSGKLSFGLCCQRPGWDLLWRRAQYDSPCVPVPGAGNERWNPYLPIHLGHLAAVFSHCLGAGGP